MSGICGILNLTGHDVPRALLTTMAGLMEYRGRDGTAHHFDGRICLGQASTHTTTQSRLVSLPLSDEETDVTLVMDGRICLLYTSPSPRDRQKSRMPSSA